MKRAASSPGRSFVDIELDLGKKRGLRQGGGGGGGESKRTKTPSGGEKSRLPKSNRGGDSEPTGGKSLEGGGQSSF